jgi:hypothetical protein
LERAKQHVIEWDAMHAAKISAEFELEGAKKLESSAIRAQGSSLEPYFVYLFILELLREKDNLKETLADRAKLKEELMEMKAKVATLEEDNKVSVAALKEAVDGLHLW